MRSEETTYYGACDQSIIQSKRTQNEASTIQAEQGGENSHRIKTEDDRIELRLGHQLFLRHLCELRVNLDEGRARSRHFHQRFPLEESR